MRHVLAAVATVVLVLAGLSVPASAAAPAEGRDRAARAKTPTVLTLTATAGYADGPVALEATLRTVDPADAAEAVPEARILVERRRNGRWRPFATLTTGREGRARGSATRFRAVDGNRFRARFTGSPAYRRARSEPVTSRLVRRKARLSVDGTHRLTDETSTVLKLRWATRTGLPVRGPVRLQRSVGGGPWQVAKRTSTGDEGRARVRVAPRSDSRWRVVADGLDWVAGGRSEPHRIDNRPPISPVDYPAAAPRPRVNLPRQARAVGDGPRAVVSTIPDGVWRSMVGRSWRSGCPVGRSGLRLLRINYWGYDGYRYRGELVAATSAADNMAGALADMYRARLPIRSMYRVDRFGYSGRVDGADDFRSMAAGNTSAFNCRDVVNRPGVRSPHSYGRALDVNTWENPYRSATGLVPNTWWASRSHPEIAWRSRSHPVVRIMLRHGFAWTYGTGDSQHFDVVGGSSRAAVSTTRALARLDARCAGVCH